MIWLLIDKIVSMPWWLWLALFAIASIVNAYLSPGCCLPGEVGDHMQ